jgi:hypothetical protein
VTGRAKDHYSVIEELARRDFAEHRLEKRCEGGSWWWRCAKPGSVFHSFNIACFPGYIVVWGDIGDTVLQISDRDSLAWLLTADSRDYFLSKVRASDGPRKQFMVDDARDHLAELEAEAMAEIADELRDDGGCYDPGQVDPDDKRLARIRQVRDAFDEYMGDNHSERDAWARAWYDAGDTDPPRCEAWSSTLCWLWEAVTVFRILHEPHVIREKLTKLSHDSGWSPTSWNDEEIIRLTDELAACTERVHTTLRDRRANTAG